MWKISLLLLFVCSSCYHDLTGQPGSTDSSELVDLGNDAALRDVSVKNDGTKRIDLPIDAAQICKVQTNGTNCPGGKCWNAECKTIGCWKDNQWYDGTDTYSCGANSQNCIDCNCTTCYETSDLFCKINIFCSDGMCKAGGNMQNKESCRSGPTGLCSEGICYDKDTGCWDSMNIRHEGTEKEFCGKGGEECQKCSVSCIAGSCQ